MKKILATAQNGDKIYEYDLVLVNVMRCSSSYSTWCQQTNKHHGMYPVKARVVWSAERSCYEMIYDEAEIKKLSQPMGKELQEQTINNHHELSSASKNILKKL